MIRIGLFSDTHGYFDPTLEGYFHDCDEIWHAGDIGPAATLERIKSLGKVVRAVYGNIDGGDLRAELPLDLWYTIGGLNIFMTHIAGHPGRYNARVKNLLEDRQPDLLICGHSHILKVIYDSQLNHLHINPGAAGHHGFHHMRTAVRFNVDGGKIQDLQVIELGRRGRH